MDHLYRELAPISEAAWDPDRVRGQEPPRHLSGRPQTGRPGRAARLGLLGHRAGPGRRGDGPAEGVARRTAARPAPGRAPCRVRACPARSSTTPTAGRGTSSCPSSTTRYGRSPLAENVDGVPRLRRGRDAGHHRAELAPADPHRCGHGAIPQGGRPGDRRAAPGRGSAAPTAWPSTPTSTPASSRRPSTAGYLLLDHLRQILGGPVVWAPGVEGGVVLSLRGGDFVLDCGAGPLHRLQRP